MAMSSSSTTLLTFSTYYSSLMLMSSPELFQILERVDSLPVLIYVITYYVGFAEFGYFDMTSYDDDFFATGHTF